MGSSPGSCRACTNAVCATAEYRVGNCGGADNGFQCVACANAQCPSGHTRSGQCDPASGRGFVCTPPAATTAAAPPPPTPNAVCDEGEYRDGDGPGVCRTCRNLECPANQHRVGTCAGAVNSHTCGPCAEVQCMTDEEKTSPTFVPRYQVGVCTTTGNALALGGIPPCRHAIALYTTPTTMQKEGTPTQMALISPYRQTGPTVYRVVYAAHRAY